MALKTYKPTSPGVRQRIGHDFASITSTTPHRPLTEKLTKTGGRNAHGRITSRFRGGGHKRRYRIVDFRRNKDGVPAKV
ncbi:MAG: 50S ribosomal protein L2, partial [Myxococcales bacterium]|nr:50S ribosomal protein L2 [Myxococcales bacterium]